eukprot:scaffold181857_cov37-Prasinocladus_malaysianus.AAC.2
MGPASGHLTQILSGAMYYRISKRLPAGSSKRAQTINNRQCSQVSLSNLHLRVGCRKRLVICQLTNKP